MTFIVLRLKSLGNIAMTVPIIYSVSRLNPSHNFIMVTERDCSDFFYKMDNVIPLQVNVSEPKIQNIKKLYTTLSNYTPDAIIDLQNNLYTKILRLAFCFRGIRSYAITKNTIQKKFLCLFGYMRSRPLKNEFDRYMQVFFKAKLEVNDSFLSIPSNDNAIEQMQSFAGKKKQIWIGIAPFAKYTSNQLSNKIIKEIINTLSKNDKIRIFLFGGGRVECEILQEWATLYPNVTNVAHRFPLAVELELMRCIDLMVCMDSANQHLAKLVGTRVITIWCATHEFAGFACWKQKKEDMIYVPRLACRPCTINGKSTCRFNNFSCKNMNEEYILYKIYSSLNL